MEKILDQSITTKLSLAISLIDDFTQREEIIGDLVVSIPELKLKAKKSPSGYYPFLDCPNGVYTLLIESYYYLNEEIANFTLPRNVTYNFPGGGGALNGAESAVLLDITGLRNGDILEFDNGSDPAEQRVVTLDADPSTKKIRWSKDLRGGLTHTYNDLSSIIIPMPSNCIIKVKLKPNHLYPFPSGATLLKGSLEDTNGNPISGASIELLGGLKSKTSKNGDYVLYFPASQEDATIQIKVTPKGDSPVTIDGEVRKGRTMSLSITYT